MFDLKKNMVLQKELVGQKGRERDFHTLDKEFHHIIFMGTRRNIFGKLFMRISTHYNRIRLFSEMQHSFDEAIEQHEKIVEILENKDCDRVEEIVREHIIEPTKLWEDF